MSLFQKNVVIFEIFFCFAEFDKDNGINGNVANKSKDGYDCFEIVSDEETGKRKKSTGEDSQTEDHNGVNKRQRFDLITEYCTDSYKKEVKFGLFFIVKPGLRLDYFFNY